MDISFGSSLEIINRMAGIQNFLLSGSCSKDVEKILIEEQFDLIIILDKKFSFLVDSSTDKLFIRK